MANPLEQLEDAVNDLTATGGLLDTLRELLPTTTGTTGEGGTHQKVSGSPAPWNGAVGGVLMAIHAGARQVEQELRRWHGSIDPLVRGGSDENTKAALISILSLATGLPDFEVRDVSTRVVSWANAAKRIEMIGEADVWVPIPREPGQPPIACPYCTYFSLRVCWQLGTVRCSTRTCRNEDGKRPAWTLEDILGNAVERKPQ